MKSKFTITIIILLCSTALSWAQDSKSKLRFFNVGVGASGWGIPVYAGVEFPVGKKKELKNDLSMALGASYQSKSESYDWFGDKITWKHTIVGINASLHYYLDRLIDLDEDFDFYAGGGIGYYSWKTTLTETSGGFSGTYSGTGSGGIGFSYLVGGRYYLTDNLALHVHYGGNTILSSARAGVSFKF